MKPFPSLGRLVPALLAVALAADVSLRFIDVSRVSFRTWGPAKRYYQPESPFPRNRRFDIAKAYGDLSSLANLPRYRQYRREVFSTDAGGFRNPPGAPPYDLVLFGDSFGAGCSLSDDETLSAQLAAKTGLKVFNASEMKRDATRMLRLTRRLGMTRGIVLYEFLGRFDVPPFPDAVPSPEPERGRLARWGQRLKRLKNTAVYGWKGFWEVSPIEIVLQRFYKRLQNDRWLPNPWASKVAVEKLVTGDPMLFLPETIPERQVRGPVDVSVFARFNREFAARGLTFVVLLVPDKFPIYRPYLRGAARLQGASPFYLDAVEAALQEAGVPAINATGALRAGVAEGLRERRYLYWRDDTHWNAQGVSCAAEAIAEQLPALAGRAIRRPRERLREKAAGPLAGRRHYRGCNKCEPCRPA
jgi:hypothetical protein